MKKIFNIVAILCVCLMASVLLSACGGTKTADKSDQKTITVAYQGGIGYAPVHIMEAKKLIEKNYKGKLEVKYIKLDSGAAINEGIIGGKIDIGCMGLSPAISGVSKGVPYKVISNLCSQSHGLMSNDPNIASIDKITSSDKIAIVSPGSFQHILLTMAAEKALGDPHALDNNVQRMTHAEGMAALEAGTIKLHLTSAPFIYQERSNKKYVELPEVREIWPVGSSHLIAMASVSLAEDKELFEAVQKGFRMSIDFANSNKEEAIQIESKYLGLDQEKVSEYMAHPELQYFSDLRGVKRMVDFMQRAGFIEKSVNMKEFCFPNVSITRE